MTTSDVSDDIFARPPRSARRRVPTPEVPTGLVRRQNCAACGLRADVLLCKECLEDVEATRSRVRNWLDGNQAQMDAAWATWSAFASARADAWRLVWSARHAADYAARCARHRAAGNVYGQLLDAHAAYEQALGPLSVERNRLEQALEVLEGL